MRKDNCDLMFPCLKENGYEEEEVVKNISPRQLHIAENDLWLGSDIPIYDQHAQRRYFITMWYMIWYNKVVLPDFFFLYDQPDLDLSLEDFRQSITHVFNTKEIDLYVGVNVVDRSPEHLYHPYTHHFFDAKEIVRLQEEQWSDLD